MNTSQVSSPISSSCYYSPSAPSDPSYVLHHPHPHSTLAPQRTATANVSPTLLNAITPKKPAKSVDCHSPAAGGLVCSSASGSVAWWTPIQTADQSNARTGSTKSNQNTGEPHEDESSHVVEFVPMSTRPRLRKVDDNGEPIWPPDLEAVLIAALRKFHATSSRPRPSASRNFNRNRLVSDYIESITGKKRSTKQIASRIQVLRDAWKGTKQYALVAQPKELSEMGYLPIAEEGWPALKVAEPIPKEITGGIGPIRSARSTRRSTRKVRKQHQPANDVLVDEPAELGATDAILTMEGGSPSSMNDQADSQVSIPNPPWGHSPAILSSLPTKKTHQPQTLYTMTSDIRSTVQEDDLRSTKSSPRQSSLSSVLVASLELPPIPFNPFDLSNLGDVITNIGDIVPDTAQVLVNNTLHRLAGVTILLAHARIPPTGSSNVSVTPSLILEVNAKSIQDKINQLQEPEEKRARLGSQLMVLQSSSVHDGARVTHARDATLVESEHSSNLRRSSQHGVLDASAEENHRYPLVLHPKARDAFERTHKQITVVQNITFLRMVDSRQLDSLMIIWIIEPTISTAHDMEFKLMRLQSAETVIKNPLAAKRTSARGKAPPSIFSSLSSPLSSLASPFSPVMEPLSSTEGPALNVQPAAVTECVDSQRLPDSPELSREWGRQSPQFVHLTPQLELLPEPEMEVERPCSPPQIDFASTSVTTDYSEVTGHASTGVTYIQGQHPVAQAYDIHASSTSPYHHCHLEYSQTSIAPVQASGMEYVVDSTPPAPFLMTTYQNSPTSSTSTHYPLRPEHHRNLQVQQQAPVVFSHHAPLPGSDSYSYATSVHQPIAQYDHQYQWVAAEQQIYAPRHIANGMSMIDTVDTAAVAGHYTVRPGTLSSAMINEEVNRPHLTLEVDDMHGWYSSGPSPISAGVESTLSSSSYSVPRRFSESSTWFVEPQLVRRASAPALYYQNSASAPFLSSQYPYASSRQGSQYNVTHEAYVHDYAHLQATHPYRGTDYGAPTPGHTEGHPTRPYPSMQGSNLNVDSKAYGGYY